ncbi:protein of unknown function [Marinobacter daqiaonensis]|uniref:DUF4468 domain-containing protein n=1 Tax=Marinobacter daqiaonensis TaxID=650891 RepID=A0A1I6HT12_9GAMM|nr:DUF4468 domain-containing protein [Marinobacter daqiaonensis]SFR57602.1 protein of unknown function [Marinobacter daqiaonensis]
MIRLTILTSLAFMLSACAGMMQEEKSLEEVEQQTFTYDYQVAGADRQELWRRARNYFDATLDDRQSEFEIENQEAGTLTGRGLASWRIAREYCSAEYHIRFQSQDEAARLELQLIEDITPFRECSGFGWPSKDAEDVIVSHFNDLSAGLEEALRED